MDKKDVERLCKILGDVIATAVPIIVDAITNYSKEDTKKTI